MNNAMTLSPATAGIDMRGGYERELEGYLIERRKIVQAQLDASARIARNAGRLNYVLADDPNHLD